MLGSWILGIPPPTGAGVNERATIDRGWFYVIEPDAGAHAPPDRRIVADDGTTLTRRPHGFPGRLEAVDQSGAGLPVATLLRAASAVGLAFEDRGAGFSDAVVELGPAGTPLTVGTGADGRLVVRLDGPAVADAPAPHALYDAVARALAAVPAAPPRVVPPDGSLPGAPAPRALFFESLMNTDMPHNDKEISQGVLHMISPLKGLGTTVVLVNAKMPIVGDDRPVLGLERLVDALAEGPIHLVGITLLEGYWEGVVKLIATLRALGCRAHIAVGGVMPSLAPEHVAAHLPDVSFVCRGAGEAFLPSLCRILGTSTVDEPFTGAQAQALLSMDGMLTVDRAGGRLLAANAARTMKVEDLDRVKLDLRYLTARHIEGGIELSTSRGCIHKCSFCSILGRESYQARSAGGVFDVLKDYERRFHELYGDIIPDNAYRVHISDDDFACDRDRARTFFEGLRDTRFRLSSVQVSIADLCRKENGKLLPEPDHVLLDAIRADCFADHGRPIPKTDFFEDHKSRSWSSFLQIGVETYCDREIARLGKGYKRVHVRAIVAELARRDLHMDGYFILSNRETSAADLVEVFSEVARLKLRFPEHFHMRFPVVQHLVSYFTSSSHRRHVRHGRRGAMILRGFASVPSHPEYDYPFVDHDEPEDAWVLRTVARTFVTDQGMYTGNLTVLSAMWRDWLPDASPAERTRMSRLLRKLDDRPRRLVFEMLRQAWFREDGGWPDARLDRERCLETAERVLGPHEAWFPVLRHVLRSPTERRLVLVTGAADHPMSEADARAAIDLLMASDQEEVALHLITPHGEVDVGFLADLLDLAVERAADPDSPHTLRVIVDRDGWELTDDAIATLSARRVEVQVVRRAGDMRLGDGWRAMEAAGIDTRVVVVVGPDDVDALVDAYKAAARAGVGAFALELGPEVWDDAAAARLGKALFAVAAIAPGGPRWVGLGVERSGRLDDVLVDADGTIGRSDGLVAGTGLRAEHRLGKLSDLSNVDRHALQIGDPAGMPGAPKLDAIHKRRAKAEKVLSSFGAWWAGRRAVADDAQPEA